METKSDKKIVCLGGGTGTSNLVRGLHTYFSDVITVLSMADSGGSGGRLRRLYNIPLGDFVTCMSAQIPHDGLKPELLTYRFPGDRYGRDSDLGGHKLGNLILVALTQMTGNFEQAVKQFQKIFSIEGTFLPATKEDVAISAVTKAGLKIEGEENIDLGKYDGNKDIEKVFLHPSDAHASDGVIEAVMTADAIICGPGDLYTTLLPVMIVPEIAEALKKSTAKKLYVINVANKPFETKGYSAETYIEAIKKHIKTFPFTDVLVNNNFSLPIPNNFDYTYVHYDKKNMLSLNLIEADLVDDDFPLFHSSHKLAKVIKELV
jgi:uncharacterized cofD-like protein